MSASFVLLYLYYTSIACFCQYFPGIVMFSFCVVCCPGKTLNNFVDYLLLACFIRRVEVSKQASNACVLLACLCFACSYASSFMYFSNSLNALLVSTYHLSPRGSPALIARNSSLANVKRLSARMDLDMIGILLCFVVPILYTIVCALSR